MRRVREYLELHLSENIDLPTLAAVAGLSMHHFARQFKQSAGATGRHDLLAYLPEFRISMPNAVIDRDVSAYR
jgi:AraC-like DNA-binding protein